MGEPSLHVGGNGVGGMNALGMNAPLPPPWLGIGHHGIAM
jgi:hypothetical protein